jgi:hypothetical protein
VLATDQGEEGVASAGLLDPCQRVDDAGGRKHPLTGVDEPPPAAIGDDPDHHIVLA